MEEGQIVEWNVSEGQQVDAGEELLEIETSKIANAVESGVGGVIRRIVAGAGETLPVGALLAVITEGEVSDADVDAFVADFQVRFVPGEGEAGAEAGPQQAEVDGRRVSYLVAGAGDATPVVLLHGFGGDANNWLFNIDALAEGRRVIAPDLPGHGASDKDVGAGSLESLARTVIGLLEQLGLPTSHFVGHSMGGAVALEIAAIARERVASLTLIAPAGLGAPVATGHLEDFIAAQSRREMKPVLQRLFADGSLVSRDMVNDVLKYKRLDGVDQALARLRAGLFTEDGLCVARHDRTLAGIRVPRLVIWGDHDHVAPLPAGFAVPEGVRFERLREVGHMPHREEAHRVNALIREQIS
jgi:pyruvate dehydrogenase E2 component (dihydrolipoamide acetyltransferase)